MNNLLEFYGTECPFCIKMNELLVRLEKEEGIKVERIEVWHNEENKKRLIDASNNLCDGVPFLLNTKTNKSICGLDSYENVKKWAKGE